MASKQEQLGAEAFRLWLQEKKSLREIAGILSISKDTAQKYIDGEMQAYAANHEQERERWIGESIAEKDHIWCKALKAFEDTATTSLNRGNYLNTALAASVARDRVRGLLVNHHEVGARVDISAGGETVLDAIRRINEEKREADRANRGND